MFLITQTRAGESVPEQVAVAVDYDAAKGALTEYVEAFTDYDLEAFEAHMQSARARGEHEWVRNMTAEWDSQFASTKLAYFFDYGFVPAELPEHGWQMHAGSYRDQDVRTWCITKL